MNRFNGNNILDSYASSGDNLKVLKPYQIVSLLVILFELESFNRALLHLDIYETATREGPDQPENPNALGNLGVQLSDDMKGLWGDLLTTLDSFCVGMLKMESVEDQIRTMRNSLRSGGLIDPHKEFADEARELRNRIEEGLTRRVFMFIPPDAVTYYQKDKLFDTPSITVSEKFPVANEEISAAGTCYATGNFTACVFHLTRALEVGLKALAVDIGAQFKDINAENWETIVKKIESEIDRLRGLPRSSAKAADLEFYAGAAKQFRYFKEHWRNPVDHFRAKYDGPQAESAINHVRDFMQQIATRLKE